jgi:hypothetical protein
MEMVKQELTTGTDGVKILVKAEHAQIKEAFKLVSGLHDAGYIAEISSGDKEPREGDWLIKVRGEGPHFIINRTADQKASEASTKNEVLKLLAGNVEKFRK